MLLSDINPFLRFAELQPSVLSSAPYSCSYDYRLFYILEGNARLFFSDKDIALSEGMLIYFRPGTPYYFDGNVKVIVLNFDLTRAHQNEKKARTPQHTHVFKHTDIIENDPPTELEQPLIIYNAFEVEVKLQDCITSYRSPSPVSDTLSSALIKEILCFALQNSITTSKKTPDVVSKTAQYIRSNYDKELSNEDIAAVFGYHSFYLNRIFKEHTGMTLHQAVLKERIIIAKRLLQSTDLPIEMIVKEANFSDRTQFCTTFRKITGNTPTEYRKTKANIKK